MDSLFLMNCFLFFYLGGTSYVPQIFTKIPHFSDISLGAERGAHVCVTIMFPQVPLF